ncbi:MAG TPA: WcbI family polysaccharide biosynthesis putative acetyltransferase [Rhizomicrobium sp.]|jgi:hypothetical protein|nr:WcbI family polysaccharide biosynthesis putative acetyltransferase [Rhizomicrobium sp.]
MKALVVTNCATGAYTMGLRAIFPKWDVKGANNNVAQKFIDERDRKFLGHLSSAKFLLTNEPDAPMFDGFAPDGVKLVIPNFSFRALQPDAFHLSHANQAVSSLLGGGNLHSRLTVTAFVLGMRVDETAAAFNAANYERCCYFDVFASERENLLGRFSAAGIDLAPELDGWLGKGNFLYTHNHPKSFVFADILIKSLTGRFLTPVRAGTARAMLEKLHDHLEDTGHWPVYPEIAARLGFDGSLVWRTSRGAGFRLLGVRDFVEQTFAGLANLSGISPKTIPGFEDCATAIKP